MGAMKRILLSLWCLLLFAILPAVVMAQPLWLTQDHNKLLALEILKPGFTFGITGRAWITQSDLSFDERTLHQLVLGGHLNVGQVQLGAQYRHWLDSNVNDDVNYVFGLTVGVVLK